MKFIFNLSANLARGPARPINKTKSNIKKDEKIKKKNIIFENKTQEEKRRKDEKRKKEEERKIEEERKKEEEKIKRRKGVADCQQERRKNEKRFEDLLRSLIYLLNFFSLEKKRTLHRIND